MSEITEKIKQELLIRCEKSKEKDGYDFWNEHIKYGENKSCYCNRFFKRESFVRGSRKLYQSRDPSGRGRRKIFRFPS